ncbi:F-box only protein 43 [Sesbania bispinosa]|nr:F-box only protein 43 [Sesbania bispinosa]
MMIDKFTGVVVTTGEMFITEIKVVPCVVGLNPKARGEIGHIQTGLLRTELHPRIPIESIATQHPRNLVCSPQQGTKSTLNSGIM